MEKITAASAESKSLDITAQNIEQLKALFPDVFSEGKIDFDALKAVLGEAIDDSAERYNFTWNGKNKARQIAQTPSTGTLRPCKEESVNWDSTENLFIEGDNLEVLKLLQKSYHKEVKMIYIDPPYNTGNDFIYEDDFAEDLDSYIERSNQKDEKGNRLVANTESNGRYHSDWLSMIFTRLKLSRDLLAEDGVIFLSIDDNEITNLRKICDEIFGEKNFIAQIVWKKRSSPPNDRIIAAQHEYILCIAKNSTVNNLNLRPRNAEQIGRYKNPDNHPKGPWVAGDLMGNVKGGRYVDSLYFPIVNPRTGQEHYPSSNGNWRFNSEKIKQLIKNDEIYFGEDDLGRPKLKRFLCDVKDGMTWTTLWDFAPFNTVGSSEMTNIFGNLTTFENPKPTGLILDILRAGSNKSAVILDFFAGSSTTAHSTMKLNAEDGGNRKFIMVQLQEVCGEKSEAYKAGFKTISDISKERIRRVGKTIVEGDCHPNWSKDVGFRVLKIDSTNMAEVYYNPDTIMQGDLFTQVENVKEDRTEEDLLFQVMLDWGIDLTLPIHRETIANKTVFFVAAQQDNTHGALVACFDKDGGIDEAFIKQLAAYNPLRLVFRDAGFASDAAKINVEQLLKQLSPTTDVKTI